MTSIADGFGEHDGDGPVNIYVKLKKLENLSNGIISSISLSIDRIGISFKDYKGSFDFIKASLKRNFQYKGPERNENGSMIYRYHYKGSQILLTHYNYSYYDEPYYNWHTITLLDPDTSLQIKIKHILETHINEESKMSLSEVEYALDPFYSDNNYIKLIDKIINHYIILRYSRENSFNQYKDTTYQGKNADVHKGTKGLRSYIKTENDRTFSRIELQANKRLLKDHGLNISSLPIEPDSIDIFDYIELRQGLNASSLDKLSSTLAKKLYESTKDTQFLDNISLSSLKAIYKTLILHELGCHSPYDLTEIPVAKQINVFKKYRRELDIKSNVIEFFPKMSWEELFSIIKEALPCKEDPLSEQQGINLTEIDPEKNYNEPSINNHVNTITYSNPKQDQHETSSEDVDEESLDTAKQAYLHYNKIIKKSEESSIKIQPDTTTYTSLNQDQYAFLSENVNKDPP